MRRVLTSRSLCGSRIFVLFVKTKHAAKPATADHTKFQQLCSRPGTLLIYTGCVVEGREELMDEPLRDSIGTMSEQTAVTKVAKAKLGWPLERMRSRWSGDLSRGHSSPARPFVLRPLSRSTLQAFLGSLFPRPTANQPADQRRDRKVSVFVSVQGSARRYRRYTQPCVLNGLHVPAYPCN
jgi:hypothetical protein